MYPQPQSFQERFSFLIEQSYSLFSRVEKNMLNHSKRFNLSISEMHLIEVINREPIYGRTVGEIASEMLITPSSVTTAVNKLIKKGYVIKAKGVFDGRQTYVQLTDKGKHADRIHRRFHKNLTNSITKSMTETEKEILINCIDRMNIFLQERIKKMEELKQ